VAGAGFWAAGRADGTWAWVGCLIGAVAGMQLRLLCNLFDGMVAIEGGFKTKSGEVFNELPDRFSDAFILVGAGYAVGMDFPFMPELGWLAAVLAVATAYVRALGVAAGAPQQFCGPMAKQQRMATLTAAAMIALGAPWWRPLQGVIPVALWVIAVGSLVTVLRRTTRIIRELESR
jgi:phosphatidylglycerophosphate synthase